MNKKTKKFIDKLERSIPTAIPIISEGLGVHSGFINTVTDIAQDVVNDRVEAKKAKKSRRLYSINQIPTLKNIVAIHDSLDISNKFKTNALGNWLIYDYKNGCFRLAADIDGLHNVNLNIGASVSIVHVRDEIFEVTSDTCRFVYDNNGNAITSYELYD